MSFGALVIEIMKRRPGISDCQLADSLGCSVQQVNGECRHLETSGSIERRKVNGIIGNFLILSSQG